MTEIYICQRYLKDAGCNAPYPCRLDTENVIIVANVRSNAYGCNVKISDFQNQYGEDIDNTCEW